MILIDNNDSFTRNLEHLLVRCTGVSPEVYPYREMDLTLLALADLLVISPGPGKPSEYPAYRSFLQNPTCPVLGVCLGTQIMNEVHGGRTDRLTDCVHGKTDRIELEQHEFEVARYHSLALLEVAEEFDVLARNESGVPMAILHRTFPLLGYQFHPESFMTSEGDRLVEIALKRLGLVQPEPV